MHPLRRLLDDAVDGRFPPVDGGFDVFVTDRPGHLGVFEFTGHSIVLVDAGAEVERVHGELARLGANGFGGASRPEVKLSVAGEHGSIESLDAVLVARGRGEAIESTGLWERRDVEEHPRVVRSRMHRSDVRVFGDESGLVTIGSGVVGRTEVSVELLGEHGAGNGRRLIEAATRIAPVGPLWAQVSPGNAASLRAFLSQGFRPVGSETIIVVE